MDTNYKHNDTVGDARKIYEALDTFLKESNNHLIKQDEMQVDQQNRVLQDSVWTRFSNSSNALPPIREN